MSKTHGIKSAKRGCWCSPTRLFPVDNSKSSCKNNQRYQIDSSLVKEIALRCKVFLVRKHLQNGQRRALVFNKQVITSCYSVAYISCALLHMMCIIKRGLLTWAVKAWRCVVLWFQPCFAVWFLWATEPLNQPLFASSPVGIVHIALSFQSSCGSKARLSSQVKPPHCWQE